MLEIILLVVTVIVLLIASYTDLKTREVPDWLSYGLIIAALGLRFIFSFTQGRNILLEGVIGFAVCFILACFLYYSQQWGGGDSKLLMGMGAVIGITYPFAAESLNLVFYIASLLVLGAFYGLFWMGWKAYTEREKFVPSFKKMLQEHRQVQWGFVILSLVLGVVSIFIHPLWLIALFPVALFYLFMFINATEKSCLLRKAEIQHLSEGEWLATPVVVDGKTYISKRTLLESDITALKELAAKKKIKEVTVKDGIPFVPSFLLAYVAFYFQPQIVEFLVKLLI